MPEVGDHNIGAEMLLPRGGQMARGHEVARSQDANGNVMVDSIQIQYWIQECIKLSLFWVKFQNQPPMSLQSQCTPSMMQMGMSSYS